MTYHYGTETLTDLNKVCPGTLYLRNAIRKLAETHGATRVTIIENGELAEDAKLAEPGKVSDAQAMALSQWAVEVDDVITVNFSKDGKRIGSLWVLYDGPYTKETAEEIVNDYSTSLGDF